MMNLQVSGYAFWTKSPFINRKVVSRFKSDHVVVSDEQIHPALHGAIRTVRRHDLVDDPIGLPAFVRRVMQMRTVLADDLVEILDSAHKSLAADAHGCWRIRKLHLGQFVFHPRPSSLIRRQTFSDP